MFLCTILHTKTILLFQNKFEIFFAIIDRNDLCEHKSIKNNNSRYRILKARIDLDWWPSSLVVFFKSFDSSEEKKKEWRMIYMFWIRTSAHGLHVKIHWRMLFACFGREEYTFPHLVTSLSVCLRPSCKLRCRSRKRTRLKFARIKGYRD